MPRIASWMVAALTMGAATSASASSILLDRHPERVTKMDIAEESRSEIPKSVPVKGPWRIVHTIDGVRTWESNMPVRPRTLFFHRPPSGMKLKRRKDEKRSISLAHDSDISAASKTDTWAFTIDTLHVRRPLGEGPPQDGEYSMRYSRAIEREKKLNRSMADLDIADFVFRSIQTGDATRHGLYLPAPSTIAFTVDVPENGVLRFDASILPPEALMANTRTDGATLLVSVGGETPIASLTVDETIQGYRIDLSSWANEEIELQFKTEPGPSTALDYVFIAEPTLLSETEDAPQMVMIFIDTLRPDAMSLYGYNRETSPNIDAWSKDAAVFTEARSVAPWTLPSTRTMYTGTQPERWDKVETLQSRLAKAGWSTAMFASNVYLSSNFNMSKDWGRHRCTYGLQGSVQVNRGIQFLEEHTGQPAFLLLHLMDMHLPYTEPIQYQNLFAESLPPAFKSSYFIRHEVTRAARSMGDEGKAYVRGRYDNNMRYLDDQIQRLFDVLDDDATVVIVSDHGEEFWEHGGFEHGHTLHDEVLRIPLVIKGPNMTPGQFDEPTSLLDVAPTMAAMQGIDTTGMVGRDLRALANGERQQDFESHPIAFGRPLYGLRQWGSLLDGQKYTVYEGKEALYDLKKDPQEKRSQIKNIDPTPLRKALSTALDRPFVPAFRVVLNRTKGGKAVRISFDQPMEAAWVGDDPTMKGKAKVDIEELKTVARWPKQSGMVEVFALPPKDMADTMDVTIAIGGRTETHTLLLTERTPPKAGKPDVLLDTRFNGRTVKITTTWVPIPSTLDSAIEGFDEEVQGDLESLGYIEKETEN